MNACVIEVLSPNTYDISDDALDENIRLMMPYQSDDKVFFDVHYKTKGSPLFIQTPSCIVPYKCAIYDDKYVYVDIQLSNNDLDKLIKRIYNIIISKIRKKKFIKRFMYKLDGSDKQQVDVIAKVDQSMKMRLRNNNVDSVAVFDNSKQRIDIRNVDRNDKVSVIFQIDRVVTDDDTISLNTKLVQIKKETIITFDPYQTDRYLFVDTQAPSPAITIPLEFERFAKMLKMGVPLMGVRQKMMLEGMTEDDYERFLSSRKQANVPPPALPRAPPPGLPPPPPPPPPPMGFKGPPAPKVSGGALPFLADIKSGNFALKKIDPVAAKNMITKKALKGVDTSKMFHVTLEDILAAKANLGKARHKK